MTKLKEITVTLNLKLEQKVFLKNLILNINKNH